MESWHDDGDEDDSELQQFDKFDGGKDAIIFLIDASSPEMHEGMEQNDDTPFQMTLKSVHSTLRRKV
jgi:hypothetical protein